MPAWRPISSTGAFQGFQLMRQAGALLTSIILAKSLLPASEIGVYEQLFFVQYAVSFFWITGLIQGLLAFYPRLEESQRRSFLLTAYFVFLGLSAVVAGILFAGSRPILQVLTGKAELAYFSLFLAHLLLNLPTFLLEYTFLLQGRGREIWLFGLVSFGGAVLVVGIPALAGWGLGACMAGLVGLGVVKHTWLLLEVLRHKPRAPKAPKTLAMQWLLLSLPLVAYAFLGGLIQTFSGWAVNWYYAGDEVQFALFRYGAREFPVILAFSEALNAALIPLIAQQGRQALPEIRLKTLRLMHGLFPLTIVLLLSSRWWFTLVFSEDFRESIPVLNAFFLIAVSRLVFPRAILIGLQDNRAILGISVLELAILAAAAFWLLPIQGIQGVALATALAFWSEKALQMARLQWRFGISPDAYIPVFWWVVYSLALLAAYGWTVW